ncbi:ATP-dependent Clp protease proteolytic subunit- related protein 1, chloroplas [Babesia divergens]|uniref:ATP-dependent Clp protease proteolytic subunit n=1 Tax=Babesia divergens TaxID=32595 RepID=A0AAD9GDL8_BABDI|nr:ATP-dependent Clp protease proteolytic subunit- related protein 1, chloroplas [Babesia divergens]
MSAHRGAAYGSILSTNAFSSQHIGARRNLAFIPSSLKGLESGNSISSLVRSPITPLGGGQRYHSASFVSAVQKNKAPDLSSALLSERTIFIGMPIQAMVAHLVISQLLYLDNVCQKPIKIYINCTDNAINEDHTSRSEVDSLSIVDVMSYVKSEIITVNLGQTYGPAALILAAGAPGKRFVLPRSFTALRQSSSSFEMMQAEDISIYSKEILRGRKDFVAALAKYCGKPESDVLETIQHGCYLDAQQTIAYGLADKVLSEYDVQ